MRKIFLFAGGLLVTMLAGCTSPSGVMTQASPIATNIPVSLDFIVVETSSSLGDAQVERQSLNDRIISDLRETQIFGTVTWSKPESGNGMEAKVEIKSLKKITANDRDWFGGLAGHAHIALQVTVSDLNTGRQIQTFAVEGDSGDSARSGTTDAAIQIAAQRVTAALVRITSQTSD